VAGALLLLLAALAAGSRLRLLVRRSRWLLLMLLLIFGWMTPGTPMPALPGASFEGVQQGGDHVARLLLALAALALMLRLLTPVELVTGARTLLAPLALLGPWRDRLAVRVALTLEAVENSAADVAPGDRLLLPQRRFGPLDGVLALFSLGLPLLSLCS